ncbi:MAG TPA: type IV pilus secretin PilQ [Pyrinomonadaceae bacterium]|jgi:type IV pilus assembly protein PilQ|nr:type IV pilus secretin PilQ [Pyrinomonadaceae bacterium]
MSDQHYLLGAIKRGALVLLIVCSLYALALAGSTPMPVATGISATTSAGSTFITISGTAPMAYTVTRPDLRTILVDLPGVDATRLAESYTLGTPLVASLQVERESSGPARQRAARFRIALRAPVRDRSQMADNNLVLVLSPDNSPEASKRVNVSSLVEIASVGAPPAGAVAEAVARQAWANAAPENNQNPTTTRPTATQQPSVTITPADNNTTQSEQGQRYGQAGFVGEPINLNVVNADIRDILNYITEQYGVNFVIDSSVGAIPVTVNVTDVPWNIALDAILRANRLGVDVNGNILRVATIEVLASETASQQKINEARLDNSQLLTEFIRLNYARASGTLAQAAGPNSGFTGGSTSQGETTGGGGGGSQGSSGEQGILPIIARRLSRRGSVEVDGRSNTLIVTDVRENIDAIRQLVTLLDQPEPQVEIETRIVIANRNFSRDLGVQISALALGTNGAAGSIATVPGSATTGAGSNITGLRPNGIPVGVGQSPTNALGANLASTVIGLTTGRIGTAQISALITAAETKGQAKVVATPRVTALNNRKAEISSGQQIPVITPQTGAGGTGGVLLFTTTYVSVPLRLEVTPQITDAGTVILRVVAENNSVNTTIATAGAPGSDTQKMETEVLVPDGGTTVVGGVLADNESERQDRTPGLASIPVVGNLFKRKLITRQTNEILFFITPRVYRPDYNGRPTSSTVSTGTRSTTIVQPVPLGNPPTNTPTPTQLQQQQPGTPTVPVTTPGGQLNAPAQAPNGSAARP